MTAFANYDGQPPQTNIVTLSQSQGLSMYYTAVVPGFTAPVNNNWVYSTPTPISTVSTASLLLQLPNANYAHLMILNETASKVSCTGAPSAVGYSKAIQPNWQYGYFGSENGTTLNTGTVLPALNVYQPAQKWVVVSSGTGTFDLTGLYQYIYCQTEGSYTPYAGTLTVTAW